MLACHAACIWSHLSCTVVRLTFQLLKCGQRSKPLYPERAMLHGDYFPVTEFVTRLLFAALAQCALMGAESSKAAPLLAAPVSEGVLLRAPPQAGIGLPAVCRGPDVLLLIPHAAPAQPPSVLLSCLHWHHQETQKRPLTGCQLCEIQKVLAEATCSSYALLIEVELTPDILTGNTSLMMSVQPSLPDLSSHRWEAGNQRRPHNRPAT